MSNNQGPQRPKFSHIALASKTYTLPRGKGNLRGLLTALLAPRRGVISRDVIRRAGEKGTPGKPKYMPTVRKRQ